MGTRRAATVGLALLASGPAEAADPLDGFEFHGYFRAGALFSAGDDWKRAKFPAQKETLGRLGIESDNYYQLLFHKTFEVDARTVTIKMRAGTALDTSANGQLGSNVDANPIGMMETYAEFGGITPTGKIWGGRRYYGRDNYIFNTDFYYSDWSGMGVGLEGFEAGPTRWDVAYVASDRSNDDAGRWAEDTNNTMHTAQMAFGSGGFETALVAKYLPDNRVPVDERILSYAEHGYEVMTQYRLDFEKGFAHFVAQAGAGLGSGQLLGGNITLYNAWRPGDLQIQDEVNITRVAPGDRSARLILWGGQTFENGTGYVLSLEGQGNDLEDDREDGLLDNAWASASGRVFAPARPWFLVATEAGVVQNVIRGQSPEAVAKLTLAPTFVIDTRLGPRPEIRLLATYLTASGTTGGEPDVLLGTQAAMWW